jgi:hypothetical protein
MIVTVDGLPAWMLSAFGSTWLATPACDRLAAWGLVLDSVHAENDDLGEILSSVIGPAIQLPRHSDQAVVERLLVTDAPEVAEAWAAAFDRVVSLPAVATSRCGDVEEATNPGRLIAAAIAAVGESSGACRQLWCHIGSLGVAWDAPLEYRDSLASEDDPLPPRSAAVPTKVLANGDDPDEILGVRQAFAGQVMLVDRMLHQLVEAVAGNLGPPDAGEAVGGGRGQVGEEAGGEADRWSVAVVGLRGMPLGLHGEVGMTGQPPAALPHGDRLQMPVVIGRLGGELAGQRSGDLLVAKDVGELLARLVAAPGEQMPASGAIHAELPAGREQVISHTPRGRSMVTPEWRLVMRHDRGAAGTEGSDEATPQLYSKPDDFFEQCDVADRCPQVVEQLRAVLASLGPDAAGQATRRVF